MKKLVIGIGLVLVMALTMTVQAAPIVTLSMVLGSNVVDPAGVAGPTSTTFELYARVTGNDYTVTGTTGTVSLGVSQVTLDLDFAGARPALIVPDDGSGAPTVTLNALDFGGTWGGLYQAPTWKGGTANAGLGLDNFLVSENPAGGNQISAPDASILAKWKRGRGADILLASGTLTFLSTLDTDTLVTVTATPSFPTAVVVWAAANPNPAATNRMLVNAVSVSGGGVVNNATGQILVKAVPEPATMGLLAIGGLLMVWRRR